MKHFEKNIGHCNSPQLYCTIIYINTILESVIGKINIALEIADRGGALYDKVCSFAESLEEVLQTYWQTQKSYEGSKVSLSEEVGNGDSVQVRCWKN